MTTLITQQKIARLIHEVHGLRMIMDSDLAVLYGVTVKQLNQQVKRNLARFPPDFIYQPGKEEWNSLRSQFVTLKGTRGSHKKYAPYFFTEHGVAMLSSVLRSERAIQVNIEIMRTFVRLRDFIQEHKSFSVKLLELEKKYDGRFRIVFEAIQALMHEKTQRKKKSIGFR
jgi:hypothetical protein